MRSWKYFAAGICCLIFMTDLSAATLILHSGRQVNGKIVEDTVSAVRIMTPAGYIKKYSREEIKQIIRDNEQPVSSRELPLPEKNAPVSTTGPEDPAPLGMDEARQMIEKSVKTSVEIMDKALDDFRREAGN